ncbi:ABC transporter substrate-binding protein [Pseudovibrio sp. Tun.PSC04-5.I4]|uniref:ABC transporter substrate-binding protein n=1 Tax=Pseudovibrio sp. Tun.PSC04-5.I4 TaxID=1798213 RepID=UPI00087E98B4|nr:ABC transporter substrate-binding protein [Pseudovibrio sp. Tun.PSC04-5.I4]SDR47298.1 amino acid ABC transporter substrate-binding protein, PAAT family [Pseudovibrio sp. Tun.PSC04-5.I4]
MKNKSVILAAAATLFASGLVGNAAAEKLRLGTEGAYPPFNYVEANGAVKGFDVEIGLELCKRIGAECEIVTQDWDGIIPGLVASKYDFIIASMFITEERKETVAFTDPYYAAAMTHVVAKGEKLTEFTNETLAGKAIGAQAGTTQAQFAEEAYPDADIRLYPTQDEVNLDMVSGRIDLQVGDMLPLWDWVNKSDDGSCCKIAGEPITDPKYVGDGVGIALRLEDTELRERFNAALAEIRADGTYKAINDKYFEIDLYSMK